MSTVQRIQATVSADAGAPARRGFGLERTLRLWGWLFVAPWIIGFFLFYLLPTVASLVFTFTQFDLTQPDQIRFIGLQNWARLFSDPILQTSLLATLRYSTLALPIAILFPLGMAALLNSRRLVAKPLLRTLFYMPYMVPVVSAVYIWIGFLNETGWVNQALESVGIQGPNWLYTVEWIYIALVLIGLWGTGNAMLTMLAGMQAVPTDLYEAAKVDGASGWTAFWKVTVPMISPVIFYNLILATIGLFKYFEIPYILKEGSGEPGNATLFYNIYLYRMLFRFQNFGYGAAMAWLLFILALIVTIFLFITARRWVYYAGGEE